MNGFSLLLVSVAVIWGSAFYRLPLWAWTTLIGCVLILLQCLAWIGPIVWLLWLIFLSVAIPLYCPSLRYRLVSEKLFAWFRSTLPAMSQTEKEAIEAGDVWWEKQLFQGSPQWQQLLDMPKPVLSLDEQAFLNHQVTILCKMLNDWEIVHEDNDLPKAVWDYLKKEKFFGIIIPKKYGGLEFSAQAHSAVITKIASRSISCAVTTMVPNSLGPAELLLNYGTSQQKEYYLPRLANGTEIPCFALTSPEAGSDAGAIVDKGVVGKEIIDGKEVVGIYLTFDKRYITLAPVATLLGLAIKLSDPLGFLSEKQELGITLCLIPVNLPGIEIGHRHFPLNLAFQNGPVRGKNVFVPLESIIGDVKMAGCGWRMLIECLSAGRGISLPALSTATALLATRMTGSYAALRRQFNMPIGEFEGVEESLSKIAGYTYLLEATRLFTCIPINAHLKPAIASAIAKYHMTEMSRKVALEAMDVHGGRGIMLGPMNYLGRAYQGVPVSITVEGANILTRSLIIFGQGAIRCHPYIKEEMLAVELYRHDPSRALKEFDGICLKHVGYFISNLARLVAYSLTRGKLSIAPMQDDTRHYVKKINWLSCALVIVSEVAMLVLGGELKRKEKISARLGDILSQLHLASAVIKYFYDHKQPNGDWPLVQWCLSTCLYQAQEAFYGFFQNFKPSLLAKCLQGLIFPFGKAFEKPSDDLTQKVAKLILTKNETRDRMTELCYVGDTSDDPTGCIELAFAQLILVESPMKKLMNAIKTKAVAKNESFANQVQAALAQKIVDEQEATLLLDFEKARKAAIAVDEFPIDYPLGTRK